MIGEAGCLLHLKGNFLSSLTHQEELEGDLF